MEGSYIYCIIEDNQNQTFNLDIIGMEGAEIYTVCLNGIMAVISGSFLKEYSISRQNLLCHEKVIEEVMKEYTVLPVRFGTIAENEEKVRDILRENHDDFKDLLSMLKGKKELGLKAIFKKDIIYKDITRKYKDIERIRGGSFNVSYSQAIEIGKIVEAALEKEKGIYKEKILETLSPLAVQRKINNTFGELMIINAAFLIEERKESEFDSKVNELDKKCGDKIKFKYVGKVPPFNFVNFVIKAINQA